MTATYNFTESNVIQQGVTWARRFVWKDSTGTPVDLTDYSAKMQGRKSVSATDTIFELSTVLGSITLGTTSGTVDLSMTSAQTAAIAKDGVYDLELTSPAGVVTRLLEGSFAMSKEVTR